MAFFTTENGDRPLTVNFFDAKEHNAIYQTLVERIFGNTALRTEADFIKLGRSLIEDEVPSNTIEYVIGFTEVILRDEYHNRKECLKLNNLIKSAIFTTMPVLAKSGSDEDIDNMQRLNDIYWRLLLAEARGKQVDSYFLYLEKNREPKDKFYQPRRTVLRKHGVIQALQAMIDDELDILCISMPPGTAKAQPLYSKVLTPSGFVTMGEMEVGTEVVAGNGNIARVIGVYPQGVKSVYEVTFDDGSKCRCSDEHLWRVQSRNDRVIRKHHEHETYRVIELSEIMQHLTVERGRRLNYSVDYVPRIDLPGKEFVIDPYVMGVLIGDGHIVDGLCVSLPDDEVKQRFSERLPSGYELSPKGYTGYDYVIRTNVYYAKGKSEYRKELDRYGLFGKHSYEKHIPREYLSASYEQRMSLLNGLMDTDGTVDKSCASYSTTSVQLARDVAELVHSVGGYASITKKPSGYHDKDGNYVECRDYYDVLIQFSSVHESPFSLPRKKAKYNPKRDVIKRFIKSVEYIGEEECQCIMIDDPCHLYITDDYIITHNTTCEKFFNSGVIGWFPKDYNLFYSHSGDITRMYYDGVYQICTDSLTYTWRDIFPELKVTSTNAKMQQFNIGAYKPFPSLQTASVGSENAGKVRASKFLLVDDMIGKLEEALNKNQLDKLWGAYSVDATQRITVDTDGKPCKEIHIATRWSVHDVIGRLERAYEGNPRFKAIAIPATYEDEHGVVHSNFDYDIGGMDVDFFKKQEAIMDDISYRCLYMQAPIEREGLLYHEDEIRRYLSLPLREPDAVLGICDTKNTGDDFMFLPVFYKYGEDYYCVDCVCDQTTNFDVQYMKMVNMIVDNKVQMLEVESNQGGKAIGTTLIEKLRERKWDCNITLKPTETNKEARIIANSYWIKQRVLFRDKTLYAPKSDYGLMMGQLLAWTQVGKNPHDDIPDGLANFALYVARGNGIAKVEAMAVPW